MNVELTQEESAAVQKALRSYLSDLRMEAVDTDNPEYKRGLRGEQHTLEAAIEKLSAPAASAGSGSTSADDADAATIRVVTLWWTED